MALKTFPEVYKTLINNFTGTKKYVDAAAGSDSNNGDSEATAYATLTYCETQISGNTQPIMIIVNPGTYDMTPGYSSQGYVNSLLPYTSAQRVYVCSPDNRTVISYTASVAVRDAPMLQQGNANSAIYGATLKRNNNGRTGNYPVAFFRGNAGATYILGSIYNCVFEETGTNGDWSLQYDNSGNASATVNNCTFYTIENGANDYSGGAGLVLNDCAFNYTYGSGSATKNTTVTAQTIDANTYELSSNNSVYGVWSGTYAWGQPIVGASFSINGSEITSANEGDVVTVTITGSTATGTRNYTISGVTSADINGASLTGSVTLANSVATFDIVLSEDVSTGEGNETLTVSFVDGSDTISNSFTVFDTSAILYITPSGTSGDTLTVRLNTSNTPETNGTQIPYTITGNFITTENIGQSLAGNFTVNNNIAEFTILLGGIPSTTLTVTAYGETASSSIIFNSDLDYDVVTQIPQPIYQSSTIQSILDGIETPIGYGIPTGSQVDDFKTIPIPKPDMEEVMVWQTVTTSTIGRLNQFVTLPLGAEIRKEYWI